MAQQWDQLRQMVMRIQHNLEQQIQARYNRSHDNHMITVSELVCYHDYVSVAIETLYIGASEEQLKEFTASFK